MKATVFKKSFVCQSDYRKLKEQQNIKDMEARDIAVEILADMSELNEDPCEDLI